MWLQDYEAVLAVSPGSGPARVGRAKALIALKQLEVRHPRPIPPLWFFVLYFLALCAQEQLF